MRGKASARVSRRAHLGIIPAHAGKRRTWFAPRIRPRDHPRSCGEKPGVLAGLLRQQGSSPLMRGKVCVVTLSFDDLGIIPAHAGKSVTMHAKVAVREDHPRSPPPGDHPRSCGEKRLRPRPAGRRGGSSPLMRGKDAVRHHRRYEAGIIPAHAGKRLTISSFPAILWDHPRSCGEKSSHFSNKRKPPGSSPLMRGKEKFFILMVALVGIIPAHAGKRGSWVPAGCGF